MTSVRAIDIAAIVVLPLFVFFVIGYGALIAQQLLLSVFVALLGVFVYVAWRRRRGS